MQFNLGVVHSTLHLDKHLAVAHFQLGVSHFLLEKFKDAIGNFGEAFNCLHKNTITDYSQLGLCLRLYSNEVSFNRALRYLRLREPQLAVRDLTESSGFAADSWC
jgi:neutrophil cytosolic factor 2